MLTRSQSLKAALAADGDLTYLVKTRIYPLVALPPHNEPSLTYKMPADFDYVLSGIRTVNVPLEMRAWANDYDVAHLVADTAQLVLMPTGQPKGFHGRLGGAAGIDVMHCLIVKQEENLVAITADEFVFEVVSHYELKYRFEQSDE